jgi:hypothetical protein
VHALNFAGYKILLEAMAPADYGTEFLGNAAQVGRHDDQM